MRLLIIVGALLLMSIDSLAMDVSKYTIYRTATATELCERLKHFQPLLDHTTLISDIADRPILECNFFWAVDNAFYDYLAFVKKKGYTDRLLIECHKQLETYRPALLNLLFQDYPTIVKKVMNNGNYKPIQVQGNIFTECPNEFPWKLP